jgi:hypothetical protein
MRLTLLPLSLLMTTSGVPSVALSTSPDKRVETLRKGADYATVRLGLLHAGWTPARDPARRENVYGAPRGPDGPRNYCIMLPELLAASGGGQLIFLFNRADGVILRVYGSGDLLAWARGLAKGAIAVTDWDEAPMMRVPPVPRAGTERRP